MNRVAGWGMAILSALTLLVAPVSASAAIHMASAAPAGTGEAAIRHVWQSNGAERGRLGNPTSGVVCGILDDGCHQAFQGGRILWTSLTGAHPVWGAIGAKYASVGYQDSDLVYPVSDELPADGGVVQQFQFGAIYWSPATGARMQRNGPIRFRYAKEGWQSGWLGFPTGDEAKVADTYWYQRFQGGSINWTHEYGAKAVRGAIHTRWRLTGYERGVGYAITERTCGLVRSGCKQWFSAGLIADSPRSGAHTVRNGAVRTRWVLLGSERDRLGYPTTEQACWRTSCYQHFEAGSIVSTPGYGSWQVWGAIRAHWMKNGGLSGRYGAPHRAETCSTVSGVRTCSQSFTAGTIRWTAARGAY